MLPEKFSTHPYETLPLQPVGIIVGLVLVAVYGWMFASPAKSIALMKKLPRNQVAGQIVMGIGLAWFWLLIAPEGKGLLSSLTFEMGEFAIAKKALQVAVPVCYFLLVVYAKEFLFVRGLGVLMLVAAAPILGASFLEAPQSRLLLPILAYSLIFKGLFYIGQPYLFRDGVTVLSASHGRWRMATGFGLAYGITVLVCAFLFWG